MLRLADANRAVRTRHPAEYRDHFAAMRVPWGRGPSDRAGRFSHIGSCLSPRRITWIKWPLSAIHPGPPFSSFSTKVGASWSLRRPRARAISITASAQATSCCSAASRRRSRGRTLAGGRPPAHPHAAGPALDQCGSSLRDGAWRSAAADARISRAGCAMTSSLPRLRPILDARKEHPRLVRKAAR